MSNRTDSVVRPIAGAILAGLVLSAVIGHAQGPCMSQSDRRSVEESILDSIGETVGPSAGKPAGKPVGKPVGEASAAPFAEVPALRPFVSLTEPSGVTQLVDGRLLIVEDEAAHALRLVEVTESRLAASGQSWTLGREIDVRPSDSWLTSLRLGPLEDIEGVALDNLGRVLVIGSHDDSARRHREERRKLVRFSLDRDRRDEIAWRFDLRAVLVETYPALAERIGEAASRGESRIDPDDTHHAGVLNIEALAFDRRRGELLVGLRTPLLGGDAIIVRLQNPDAWMDRRAPARFAPELLRLDLDGGGLRALCYDDRADQLWLVSRREGDGEQEGKDHGDEVGDFRLWRLPLLERSSTARIAGSARAIRPRLVMLPEPSWLESVEGLTVLDRDSRTRGRLLFVRDERSSGKTDRAHWFALPRESLTDASGRP